MYILFRNWKHEFAGNINDDLITQFNKGVEMLEKKWPVGLYIGYFQARTNTFAPYPF